MQTTRCYLLVLLGLFLAVSVSRADLNSGTDDDDDELSLDATTGGQQMKYKEDILNSLPKMPEQPSAAANNNNKEPQDRLQIGIKKRVDDCKRKAAKGDMLHMHYRGSLKDGTEFDNSYKRGEPLKFQLGTGQVIKGWDLGLVGICAGEKRRLKIPPHLAYGEMGSPPTIPPNSMLVFEVEAVKIVSPNEKDEL